MRENPGAAISPIGATAIGPVASSHYLQRQRSLRGALLQRNAEHDATAKWDHPQRRYHSYIAAKEQQGDTECLGAGLESVRHQSRTSIGEVKNVACYRQKANVIIDFQWSRLSSRTGQFASHKEAQAGTTGRYFTIDDHDARANEARNSLSHTVPFCRLRKRSGAPRIKRMVMPWLGVLDKRIYNCVA